jgi:hypothetical protein
MLIISAMAAFHPLTESEVARMCGISDEEYAAQAQKLKQLKAAGHYTE